MSTNDPGARNDTALLAGQVEIWSAALDPALTVVAELAGYLSAEEHARAARFASAPDRDRFIVGRAFLRLLLARSTGLSPGSVPLRQAEHGKPEVEGGNVSFNLAHSGDLAVCALGPGRQAIGIDIERVKPLNDPDGVVRMIASPRERESLALLPERQRLRRLFEIWTCKEAVLKGAGTGLDRPLTRLEVAFTPGEEPRLQDLDDPGGAVGRFWLSLFEPASGCIGAVATTVPIAPVRCLEWRWQ